MNVLATLVMVIVLMVTLEPGAAQTGTAPYCLQTSGGTRCVFGTMGDCENARSGMSSAQCITNSDAHGTTGLGERPAPGPYRTPLPQPNRDSGR
jgi:hypothetical protein